MMKTIGITGGIGAGKSIVSKIIQSLGFPVFYSDIEAKKITNSHPDVKSGLKTLIGEEVFVNDELNRALLAQHIFSNPETKSAVNALIHPLVRKAFDDFAKQSNQPLVFNEAAILFETGSYTSFDVTVLVTAPVELRIERVMKRDGVTRQQVLDRMKNQWSDEQKAPLADYLISNDEVRPLLMQVENLLQELLS